MGLSVKLIYPLPGEVPHRLLIDKLALTIKPPNLGAYADYLKQLKNMSGYAGASLFYAPGATLPKYPVAYRIKAGSGSPDTWPVLQVGKPSASYGFIRLEFNPDRLGPAGVAELRALLDQQLIPDGYPLVLFYSRVSRIDLAIDFPGVSLDQVLLSTKWPTYAETWRHTGEIETIYLGKRKESNNYYRIYNRLKSSSQPGQCLRVERVLRQEGSALAELGKLQNPFDTLKISRPNIPCPRGIDLVTWRLFLRVLQVSGSVAALFMLEKKERDIAKNQLSQFSVAQIDLTKIWGEWPGTLIESGLLNFGPEGPMTPTFNHDKQPDQM